MKNLKKFISNIPQKPGVYIFKDKFGNVLYIGKAVNLNKRVKSYFRQINKQSTRIQKMISQINEIDYTVVNSELEAIILETNLIKEKLPKYNIMMKDDKNFVYIKITQNEDFPRILIVRKILNDGALYFGPKTAANKVKKTLDVLKKIFPYRDCNLGLKYKNGKIEISNKMQKYPCLNYHIKRCLAPCIGNCTKEEYNKIIQQIIKFLRGKTDEIIENLSKEMQKAALDKKFEKAASLRDKLHAIQEISEKQLISTPKQKNIDVINFKIDLGRVFFTLFMIRGGKLINQENFIFKTENAGNEKECIEEKNEILESFVKQYYEKTTDFPKEILMPQKIKNNKIIEKWLTNLKGSKISLIFPQKGEKVKILDLAFKNAEVFASQSRTKWQDEEQTIKKALNELKEKLKLKNIPHRIECYDISHLSGTNQVASMVVFENGVAAKKKYRRFKIKTVKEGKPDDFTAMFEVLERRFLYLKKSKSNIKLRKISKNDAKEISKIFKIKKLEGFLKAFDSKNKLIGIVKHETFKNLDCFKDINFIKNLKDNEKIDFIRSFINRGKKNRLYILISKKSESNFIEAAGFRAVKKIPDEIKIKRTEICFLLDKSKYKEEESFKKQPNLILIDGGKGQLSQAVKIEKKYNVKIPIIALAKKNEEVFGINKNGKFKKINFDKNSDALYLLQQIRDEAHRFAISYQKNLREKSLFTR
jgi:excinuclease ABC subunit C